MEYKVKITPYALRQMQEIVRYISSTLQSQENAARWLDTIEKEIASLSSMPARIPLTEEEPWHSQGIHKMVVKKLPRVLLDRYRQFPGLDHSCGLWQTQSAATA